MRDARGRSGPSVGAKRLFRRAALELAFSRKPRIEGIRYIDVDEQDFLDPAPALQVIKETLAEGKKN